MLDNLYKQFVETFGWLGLVYATTAFIIASLLIYYFKIVIKKRVDSNRIINDNPLKYHAIFGRINHTIKIEIPNLVILKDKPVRDKIFKDLLTIFLQNFHRVCTEITDYPVNDWSTDRWVQKITSDVSVALQDFERQAHERGIPQQVVRKFNKWNQRTIDLLQEYIMSTGTSTIHENNITRTNTFLSIMNLLLVTTVVDAERTLKELNGEITGLMYEGRPIEE